MRQNGAILQGLNCKKADFSASPGNIWHICGTQTMSKLESIESLHCAARNFCQALTHRGRVGEENRELETRSPLNLSAGKVKNRASTVRPIAFAPRGGAGCFRKIARAQNSPEPRVRRQFWFWNRLCHSRRPGFSKLVNSEHGFSLVVGVWFSVSSLIVADFCV